MSKFTPGPWVWHKRLLISRQEYRPGYVAEVLVCECVHDQMPDEAAAALIAAAPEMFEALRAAKEFLVSDLEEPGRTVFWKVVSALDKAEGKTNE